MPIERRARVRLCAGGRVPHRHVHVIIRHPGAPQEYWGVRVDEWPDAPQGDEAEITALVARLRTRIETTIVCL
jgi:diadenosine tetraphosphate (Ap4A) HIT family hydrolase